MKLRTYMEELSQLGISIRVSASARGCEAAVKGIVFNDEVYSVCTNVPVEIEMISSKGKKAEDLSEEEGTVKRLPAADADSASENEVNPSIGTYRIGFCIYRNINFVQRINQAT